MAHKETFHIKPTGWESPKEEWRRLSPLDMAPTQVWNNWAIFFEIKNDGDKPAILNTFKQALGNTLAQCRHVAGNIEKNEFGDFSLVTKPDSAITVAVRWADRAEDELPSFKELERAQFCVEKLGNPNHLTVYARSSEATPATRPPAAAFQVNFIPGGMIIAMSKHHWAMDAAGWSGFLSQLAAHCFSIENGSATPTWDEGLMDRSCLIPSPVAEEDMKEAPPAPLRHPDRKPCSWLLYHISRSNAIQLKELCAPSDGSWISTYDAVVAYVWRILSKHRAQIYKADLGGKAIFGETVDMRNRGRNISQTPFPNTL